MRRLPLVAVLFALAAVPLSGQTTGAGYADALSPSLASVAKVMHGTIRKNLAEAAESMPAGEYAFRPTPEVRSFAQLLGHVINANYFFCSQINGEPYPGDLRDYEKVSDKATLVKALNDALGRCDKGYAATTDATFNQPVKMASGVGMGEANTVRGAIMMFNITHNNEHYGNIVVYMRLKGHVPPSTANTPPAKR